MVNHAAIFLGLYCNICFRIKRVNWSGIPRPPASGGQGVP